MFRAADCNPLETCRCVQLPEPFRCYQSSEPKYGKSERKQLYTQLSDKVSRKQPFGSSLETAFGGARYARPANSVVLLGSPVVDDLQGSYKGLDSILRTLRAELQIELPPNQAKEIRTTNSAVDDSAATDVGCNWVQCDRCEKWRTLPWYVDSDTLVSTTFQCSDSSKWGGDDVTCQTPEDRYDCCLPALALTSFVQL